MRVLILLTALQSIWLTASAQEQWFSDADITGLNPPTAFAARNHAVSFVIGDTAYVGTGDGGSATLTDFWKYVPATKTWTQIADFPGHRRKQAVAFVIDGKGYVGTGRSGTTLFDDFYRYDPLTDTWEAIADFGGGDRRNAIAFVVDGKAYVGTGYNTSNPYNSINVNVTDDLWQYDPQADQWTKKDTKIPGARGGAMTFSMNGKGYIAGGYGVATKNIYEYDPDADSYTKGFTNDFMYDRKDGVAFVLNDEAYIGLGIKHPSYQATDFFIFSSVILPITSQETDQEVDDFGDPTENNRSGAIAFVVRGKAFVGLGNFEDDSNNTTQKEDIWSFQSPVPDTPKNLTVVTPTQTSVTLRWTSHANNETGYEIERSTNDTENFTLANGGITGIDVTEYEQTALPVDKELFYRVRTTGAQNSPYSDTVVVNTYNPPSDLTANLVSTTEITLNWQDNSTGEQGFIVQRSTNGTSYVDLGTVLADVTTFSDQTVQPGFDYTYRILAQATESVSPASNTITAGSLIDPTDLTAEATGGAFVQLRWTYAGNNAGRFVIERQDSEGGAFALIANVAATASPSYQDKTVGEGAFYTYRVKAENLPRASANFATASITTRLLAPTAVTATVQDSAIAISWSDVSKHEVHYVVQRLLADGSALTVLDTLAANANAFLDTDSLSEGNYRYAVQALGTSTNSARIESNTIIIVKKVKAPAEEEPTEEEEMPTEEPEPTEEETPEVVTGTGDLASPNAVKVYPNPSDGQAEVYVGEERFAYIAIFNSQGRLVDEVQQAEQGSLATVRIDLEYLPVGVYTLRVYTSRGVFVRKLARQ